MAMSKPRKKQPRNPAPEELHLMIQPLQADDQKCERQQCSLRAEVVVCYGDGEDNGSNKLCRLDAYMVTSLAIAASLALDVNFQPPTLD